VSSAIGTGVPASSGTIYTGHTQRSRLDMDQIDSEIGWAVGTGIMVAMASFSHPYQQMLMIELIYYCEFQMSVVCFHAIGL